MWVTGVTSYIVTKPYIHKNGGIKYMSSELHILIVDDDPSNLYFLSEILKELYETSTAQDGEEALTIARQRPPDLVLMDVSMPVMSGYEVCQKFKTDPQLSNIPIIFLSAIDSMANKVKGFEVGGVDYITKPFHVAEVFERVKTHLGLRHAQRELQRQNDLLQAEINRRQDVEHKLRENEQKYRLLFEKTNDAVFINNLDSRQQEVNQQAANLLGYSIDEINKKLGISFVVKDEREAALKQAERILAGEVLAPYEHRFKRKDGTTFLAEMNVSLIRDDSNGEPLYYHTVLRDITERKRLQDALQESERLYREILENAGEAVFATDIRGNFTYVNQIMSERSEFTEEDLLGKHFTELIDEDWRQRVAEFYQKQFTDKITETLFSFPLIKSKDKQIWLEQTTTLVMDGEKITGFLGITRDITKRRQIEIEREQLISELDAFAHTVAHDLKNPLGALRLYSDMLEKMYHKMPEEKRRSMITSIQSVTIKMTTIIDSLLLLSSVRKQSDIDICPLEMSEIIVEVENRLKPQIEQYKAKYTIADNLPTALGYAPWVEEIWVNYISNALKYGGSSPKFEIGAETLDNKSVRYWVKDNGNGLSAEEQKLLFTPFTRLNKVAVEGHGLGLSIVQRITEKLNGYVGIESEVGKGSTFYFVLPTTKLDRV